MANKIKSINKFWVDNRGNRWDKQCFSKDKALEHSENSSNSFNCYNCTNCKNCKKCVECNDCHDCSSCHGCNHCTSCKGCHNCFWSHNCTNCSKCEDCISCSRCKSCYDCTMCKSCKHCRNNLKKTSIFNNYEEVYNFFYETYDLCQVVGAFGNDDGYYWDKEYHIIVNQKETYVFLVTGSASGYKATMRNLKKCPLNYLEKRKKGLSCYNEVTIEDFKDDESEFIHLYGFMNGINAKEVQENEDTFLEYHYELNVIE